MTSHFPYSCSAVAFTAIQFEMAEQRQPDIPREANGVAGRWLWRWDIIRYCHDHVCGGKCVFALWPVIVRVHFGSVEWAKRGTHSIWLPRISQWPHKLARPSYMSVTHFLSIPFPPCSNTSLSSCLCYFFFVALLAIYPRWACIGAGSRRIYTFCVRCFFFLFIA